MNRFITPIILIAISAGIFYTFIDPQYKEAQALQATHAKYDQAINKSRELIRVRDTLLSKRNQIAAEDLERLEKMLPDNIDTVKLILDVNGITSKYGVALRNVKVNTPAPDTKSKTVSASTQKYDSVDLSFSFNAPYSTFLRVIRDLESSLRIADITSVSLRSSENEIYQYDIAIKTYWLK